MDIKSFLLKESCNRTDEIPIRNFLLEDAEFHLNQEFEIRPLIKEASAKKEMLSDGMFHLAFLDKEAMPLMPGVSNFAYASNIEFEDFPFDDHKKIASIQNAVKEKFVPLLIHRIKTAKGQFVQVDLREVMGKKDDPISPFYIRLKFKKHLLPSSSAPAIRSDMAELSPELVKIIDELDETSIGILPYYNKTEQNKKEAIDQLANEMQWNVAKSQSFYPNHLKDFWAQMQDRIVKGGKDWPKLFGQISRREYSRSIIRKAEEVDQMRSTFELLWAIHYAENPPNKPGIEKFSLFDSSPQVMEEKREKLLQFLLQEYKDKAAKIQQSPVAQNDKIDYQSLAYRKAKESFERIWRVFSLNPETRDISKMKLRGGAPPPYDKLTQNDLRSMIKFLKIPELRFHAMPRKFPNGIDMDHIYPPVEYDRDAGEFDLDYKSGNFGLVECKRNLDAVIDILETYGPQFSKIYEEIMSETMLPPDVRKLMSSHTGADNLLFMFDELQNLQVVHDATKQLEQSPVADTYYGLYPIIDQIKSQYGDRIASWIIDYLDVKFANKDKKKIQAQEKHLQAKNPDANIWAKSQSEALRYAEQLGKINSDHGGDVEAFAAQLLKTQPIGNKANRNVLTYAPMLYRVLITQGYHAAKIFDLVNYLILKHTEDPVFGVRGRNYSTGGVSGEVLLGIEYASNVPLRKIHHGEELNVQMLQMQGKDPFGSSPEQLRQSPYAPHAEEEALVMPSEKPVSPEIESTYAGDRPVKLLPAITYTVLQTSKAEKGMLRSTRYKKKELEVGEEGLGSEMQETGYIGKNRFDTLEEALTKLENLYAGAKDLLGDRFELINQRMDLATKRIRQAIETAIELRDAEIKATTGLDIKSETGQSLEQSLTNLNKDIVETQDKIMEVSEDYFDKVESAEEFSTGLAGMPTYTDDFLTAHYGSLLSQGDKFVKALVLRLVEMKKFNALDYMVKNKIPAAWIKQEYLNSCNEKLVISQQCINEFIDYLEYYIKSQEIKQKEIEEKGYFTEEKMSPEKEKSPFFVPLKEPKEEKQESVIDRLVKVADRFDKNGQTVLANKVDLLLEKIKKDD